MKVKELRGHCQMDSGTKDLLKAAIAQFNLSRRGHDRMLKVSRRIANLKGAANIEMHHVAEAINYHAFDRKLFGRKPGSSEQPTASIGKGTALES